MQAVWYQRPPESISLQEANQILSDPSARQHFPNQWAALLTQVKEQTEHLKEKSKEENPLGWFQPSYEQSLKLNSWLYGIDYLVDFDANRIGKTAAGVVNALLWILPHDLIEDSIMFRSHTDEWDRTFQVFPRPPITLLKPLRQYLSQNNFSGDPKLPHDHPTNLECSKAALVWTLTQQHLPNPPKRTIWVGGPDNEWNEKNIIQEWLKWTPHHFVHKYSKYEGELLIHYPQPLNKIYPISKVSVLFKSYDSQDTKWSGGAVDGIMMSEGIPSSIFNEIRQRYKYPAFASWDYTPYEPRNTAGKSALAYKVYDGKETLPLTPCIFSGFGIEKTPTYIMDAEKRSDLIAMWEGKPEGDARIKGIFYTSSPIVLKNYTPSLHCLSISFAQLRKLYAPKPLILFRGVDPGWGHVTSCTWMALAPDNTRYIYQVYSRSQRSIEERCQDIITLSQNIRKPNPRAKGYWLEEVTNPLNQIRMTWIDYHTFKTDEQTKNPYANNYIKHGLIVRPSITFGPKERATMLNDLMQPQLHLPHPITQKPPGSKLYFLINEPGVAAALQKMSNVFYQTFEKGEKRGLTKEAIQDFDDDELDSTCYVTCPTLTYSSFVTSQTNQNTGQLTTPVLTYSNVKFV